MDNNNYDEYFPVIYLSRKDIEQKGFYADDLDNATMAAIADKMADLMLDGCDYWTAVEEACYYYNIKRKQS